MRVHLPFHVSASFIRSTADFHQGNLEGIQAEGTSGILLSDGNFIFKWKDGNLLKMVLTNNDGSFIKSGFVAGASTNWQDSSSWSNGGYSISNFQGSTGGK